MLHHIFRLVESLLRLLLPASGRRRHFPRGGAPLTPMSAAATGAPNRELSPHEVPLRGEDSPLVRPYLLAHEQREPARQQHAGRRTLWLAVHGVDVTPHRSNGVGVAAA
ncbi:hypothetical protein [Streptomyces shenzhenensis]|uniref:hypothetical protein n=1 Tax=Streptomyces shenzhenensis TaxID=943815 RepID=UPI002867B966|nr:hypothetical protein [Streptomyces shenzhenensis]